MGPSTQQMEDTIRRSTASLSDTYTSSRCLQLSGPTLDDTLLPNVPLGLGVPNEARATEFASDPGWVLRSPIKESQTPIKVQLDVEIKEKVDIVRVVFAQWMQEKTQTTDFRQVHAGLVLKRVEEAGRGDTYTRVGYWEQKDYVNADGPKIRMMHWKQDEVRSIYLT